MLKKCFKLGLFILGFFVAQFITFYLVLISAGIFLAVIFDSYDCKVRTYELGCRIGATQDFDRFVQIASYIFAAFIVYEIVKITTKKPAI